MKVLSQPFRFNPGQPGSLATVEQGTDAQKGQEVATFLLTHRGERPIYQEYGIDDPTFDDFNDAEFGASFATFYRDITLESIVINNQGDGTTRIDVTFE